MQTRLLARAPVPWCVFALMASNAVSLFAQVNSWINPTSGNWDQASAWSLGVLPNSLQSVMITNSGWKAVAINPSTPVNFPESMTVSNLAIRGAWNTRNVLLLNFFGTAIPLTVLQGLTVQDNAQIVNLESGLVVGAGTITVTNAQFIQNGGFVRTTNATMYLQAAEYDLTNGVLEAGQVLLGFPVSARFNQHGGAVAIYDLRFGIGPTGSGGAYSLYGGYLSLPGGLSLTGSGNAVSSYYQAGGTNQTTTILIEPGYAGISPVFTLDGGVLAGHDVAVVGDDFGSATLTQNGGTHIITNTLSVSGGLTHGTTPRPGTYRLNNGLLSAGAIELNANSGDAVFEQASGTTRARTFYAHSTGYFGMNNTGIMLNGGTLSCSNFSLVDGGGRLSQTGGDLVVTNQLAFGGFRDLGLGGALYGTYAFTGGTLFANDIDVGGNWFIGDSGTANRITNPGTCRLSHRLTIGNAAEQLGRFNLAGNAIIDLSGTASQLSFANSSGEAWSAGATLIISNWNGNVSGGGSERLKFGTDASGLSPAQLSQVRFSFGANSYTAKILATGEVVPDEVIGASVAFARQGNSIVLTWPSGWFLQGSTNVGGLYTDIPNASSPYTINTTLRPQQFFRLRQ